MTFFIISGESHSHHRRLHLIQIRSCSGIHITRSQSPLFYFLFSLSVFHKYMFASYDMHPDSSADSFASQSAAARAAIHYKWHLYCSQLQDFQMHIAVDDCAYLSDASIQLLSVVARTGARRCYNINARKMWLMENPIIQSCYVQPHVQRFIIHRTVRLHILPLPNPDHCRAARLRVPK